MKAKTTTPFTQASFLVARSRTVEERIAVLAQDMQTMKRRALLAVQLIPSENLQTGIANMRAEGSALMSEGQSLWQYGAYYEASRVKCLALDRFLTALYMEGSAGPDPEGQYEAIKAIEAQANAHAYPEGVARLEWFGDETSVHPIHGERRAVQYPTFYFVQGLISRQSIVEGRWTWGCSLIRMGQLPPLGTVEMGAKVFVNMLDVQAHGARMIAKEVRAAEEARQALQALQELKESRNRA